MKRPTVVIRMIHDWKIRETDFMGFYIDRKNEKDYFSYHHLRTPKSKGGIRSIHNGSVLCRCSSHDYIHIIERYDMDVFDFIKGVMIEVNEQGYLPTSDQIVRINGALCCFEREYSGLHEPWGPPIIRENFARRLTR